MEQVCQEVEPVAQDIDKARIARIYDANVSKATINTEKIRVIRAKKKTIIKRKFNINL